jgi:hypothetical protein
VEDIQWPTGGEILPACATVMGGKDRYGSFPGLVLFRLVAPHL